MLKKIFTVWVLFFAFSVVPMFARAAIFNNLTDLITRVCQLAGYMFTFLLLLGVTFVLVAAFKYLTGSGDPKKISETHMALTYAAIGIAVGFIARGVPYIVASFFGITVSGC